MKKIFTVLIIVCTILMLQSCKIAMNVRNSNKHSGIVRVKQLADSCKSTILWAHYDATQRQTLMQADAATGLLKVLAEQSPDAGLSKKIELDPHVKIDGKVDANLLLKTQTDLEKLTNRTTSLMITREALYRLQEASFNGFIDKNQYFDLYNVVITQASILVKEETGLEEQKAKTAQAEADKAKTELETEKLKTSVKTDTTSIKNTNNQIDKKDAAKVESKNTDKKSEKNR